YLLRLSAHERRALRIAQKHAQRSRAKHILRSEHHCGFPHPCSTCCVCDANILRPLPHPVSEHDALTEVAIAPIWRFTNAEAIHDARSVEDLNFKEAWV